MAREEINKNSLFIFVLFLLLNETTLLWNVSFHNKDVSFNNKKKHKNEEREQAENEDSEKRSLGAGLLSPDASSVDEECADVLPANGRLHRVLVSPIAATR